VTTHRKNIFRKLGINTAHEAVKYALRAGLIDPSEFYI
jgi:DNA-binding CsgD family transcriptional regulator